MSKKWVVERPEGELESVVANRMELSDGVLSFKHDGRLVVAFSPWSWASVVEVED